MKKEVRILAVAIEANIPVLLLGAPGIGKSQLVNEIARKKGWPCQVIIASLHDPSDFLGLPFATDSKTAFLPPEWAVDLASQDEGILFLDELTLAPPAIQAAALRVVLEGVVGSLQLPKGIRRVAAGNPEEETEGAWNLTPPLRNRFLTLHVAPDVEEVVDYFLGGSGFLSVPDVPKDWQEKIPEMKAKVASFLSRRPELLYTSNATKTTGPFPSPRSWELVAKFMAAANGILDFEELGLGIAGLVGEGTAVELLQYLENLDLPSPEEILKGAKLPEEEDRLLACFHMLASYVSQHPEAGVKACEILCKHHNKPDLVLPSLKRVVQVLSQHNIPRPDCIRVFGPLLKKIVLSM